MPAMFETVEPRAHAARDGRTLGIWAVQGPEAREGNAGTQAAITEGAATRLMRLNLLHHHPWSSI